MVSNSLFYSRKFIVIEFLQISCVDFVFGILGFWDLCVYVFGKLIMTQLGPSCHHVFSCFITQSYCLVDMISMDGYLLWINQLAFLVSNSVLKHLAEPHWGTQCREACVCLCHGDCLFPSLLRLCVDFYTVCCCLTGFPMSWMWSVMVQRSSVYIVEIGEIA